MGLSFSTFYTSFSKFIYDLEVRGLIYALGVVRKYVKFFSRPHGNIKPEGGGW